MIAVLKKSFESQGKDSPRLSFEADVGESISRRIRCESRGEYRKQMEEICRIQGILRSLESIACEGKVSINVQDGFAVCNGKMEVLGLGALSTVDARLKEARITSEKFAERHPRSTFSFAYQQTLISKNALKVA